MIRCIYDLIYTLPLGLALMTILLPYLSVGIVGGLHYAVVGISALFITGFRNLETRFRILLLGSFLILAAGFYWLTTKETKNELFMDKQWIGWLFFLMVLCFFAGRLVLRFRALRYLALLAVFVFLLLNVILSGNLHPVGVCMLLVWSLLLVMEEIQSRWKKSGYTDPQKHMVFLSPFFLLGLVLLLVMPVSENPYSWSIVRNIMSRLKTQGIAFSQYLFNRKEDNYSTAFLGFSEQSGMAGSLTGVSEDSLQVTFYNENSNTLYLKGKVFDSFEGGKWISENTGTLPERMMDTLETYSAVLSQKEGYFSDYLQINEVEVTFLKFTSQYVFSPLKMVTNYEFYDLGSIQQQGGDLLFSEKKRYLTHYTLRYYRLNTEHDIFKPLFAQNTPVSKEAWEQTVLKHGFYQDSAYSYENYLSYVGQIDQNYLSDISATKRTISFLEELTEGASSDYEKLMRLEAVFQGMEYNISPGPLPKRIQTGGDFLDYFLFEKQSGYCSHYATAFALAARALGIPSRYNQGFLVHAGYERTVLVNGTSAHAWPECYLKGVGWISFEPTPGYKMTFSWMTAAEKEEYAATGVLPGVKPEQEYIPPQIEEEEDTKENRFRFLLIVLGGFVTFLLIYVPVEHQIAARRYLKKNIEKRWKICLRKNERLYQMLGYTYQTGETIGEFKDRLEEIPEEATEYLKDQEAYLYGDRQITDSMLLHGEKANRILCTLLKEKKILLYLICYIRGLNLPKTKN